MSDDSEKAYSIDTKDLDGLLKALKGALPNARIGILGAKSSRAGGTEDLKGRSVSAKGKAPKTKFDISTNAAVGVLHEFGTKTIPMRSFLRVPIAEHLQAKLDESGMFTKEAAKQVMKEGSMKLWLLRAAILAEAIVFEAFDTQGFGKWAPWKTPGYTNNTMQILQDTQQLRNSITSEVK